MTSSASLDRPMAPLWIAFPGLSELSIGWRMGDGEHYKYELGGWLDTLTPAGRARYAELFPVPALWWFTRTVRGGRWWEEVDDAELADATAAAEPDLDGDRGLVVPWRPDGVAEYTRERLMTEWNPDRPRTMRFFWKPSPGVVDDSCLGQWQPTPFRVDAEDFSCTEQYMMVMKARLFGDDEVASAIMATESPKEMKALGKKARGFDQELWDRTKHSIVLAGNYHKFTQNPELMDYLLGTGDEVLVEASPLDMIWGIGLSKDKERAANPATWRGRNLLGFALMEVRDEIRRVYANVDLLQTGG